MTHYQGSHYQFFRPFGQGKGPIADHFLYTLSYHPMYMYRYMDTIKSLAPFFSSMWFRKCAEGRGPRKEVKGVLHILV